MVVDYILICFNIGVELPEDGVNDTETCRRDTKIVFIYVYTVCLQMNGAVLKVNKFISHLTRAKRTPSAAATVLVSHALPAVRFACLLPGRGVSSQDGAAAGKGFLCAPF